MGLKYFKTKIVYIAFVFVMLLQSCSVYKTNTVTLTEASDSKTKVKILKSDGEKICFKKIEQTDGVFYGLKKSRWENGKNSFERE